MIKSAMRKIVGMMVLSAGSTYFNNGSEKCAVNAKKYNAGTMDNLSARAEKIRYNVTKKQVVNPTSWNPSVNVRTMLPAIV